MSSMTRQRRPRRTGRSCDPVPSSVHSAHVGQEWKSITDGTPITAARSAFGGWNSERRANFLKY
jgi:hypothetical protein